MSEIKGKTKDLTENVLTYQWLEHQICL